jgi:hypothetical protein
VHQKNCNENRKIKKKKIENPSKKQVALITSRKNKKKRVKKFVKIINTEGEIMDKK